jgi:hypothetical protein
MAEEISSGSFDYAPISQSSHETAAALRSGRQVYMTFQQADMPVVYGFFFVTQKVSPARKRASGRAGESVVAPNGA